MSATGSPRRSMESARDDPSLAVLGHLAFSRFRHGLALWTALVPPLALSGVLAATVFPASDATVRNAVWDHWFGLTLYLWAVLAPMCGAMFAVSTHRTDEEAKRVMYSYAFPRRRLLFAEFTAIALLWAVSALLLATLVSIAAAVHGSPGDAAPAFAGALMPVLAALPTLALCLLAAEAWGAAGATCTGVAGLLFGALSGDKALWWTFPPAWPTRSVIPIAETRGIGGYYAPDHPLLDLSALSLVASLAVASTAVFLAAAAWYTDHREL